MGDFATEWERPEFDSVPSLAENAVYLLPGCDDVLLRKSLQWAYRDFCRRSAALRTWRQAEPEAGARAWPVVPVLSAKIDCVTQVCFAHPRRPVQGWRVVGDPPMLELPRWLAGHDFFEGSAKVEYVQDKINVGSLPVETDDGGEPQSPRPWGLWVEAVEMPHIGEERAPKAFLRRYGDAIIDGALARMLSMQGRPWTDLEQCRQHAVAYENAVSEARLRGMQGGPAANAGATCAIDMGGMV